MTLEQLIDERTKLQAIIDGLPKHVALHSAFALISTVDMWIAVRRQLAA
jgi:hypothetical protein